MVIIRLSLLILLILFFLSCGVKDEGLLEETNQGYYQADYHLVSKRGIMVFIPRGALMKGGKEYVGKLWVDLAKQKN